MAAVAVSLINIHHIYLLHCINLIVCYALLIVKVLALLLAGVIRFESRTNALVVGFESIESYVSKI